MCVCVCILKLPILAKCYHVLEMLFLNMHLNLPVGHMLIFLMKEISVWMKLALSVRGGLSRPEDSMIQSHFHGVCLHCHTSVSNLPPLKMKLSFAFPLGGKDAQWSQCWEGQVVALLIMRGAFLLAIWLSRGEVYRWLYFPPKLIIILHT